MTWCRFWDWVGGHGKRTITGEERQRLQMLESSLRRLERAEQCSHEQAQHIRDATETLRTSITETLRSLEAASEAGRINRGTGN